MFDYNVELAVKELFLFQYVLADAIAEQSVFELLCKIYCICDSDRDELAVLLADERLANIRTLTDYFREMRLNQYFDNFVCRCDSGNERLDELIAIKGAAFERAQKVKLVSGYEKSCGVAYDELVSLTFDGVVAAKRILGILQTEGIYITMDKRAGAENLRFAAAWSDIPALVALIYYDADNRQDYFDRLYTVTRKTDYAVIVEELQIQYGIDKCEESATAKLLEKAFAVGAVKRDVCSSRILRIFESNVLSDKDKRTIVLSGNNEHISAVCGLPLRLTCDKIPTSVTDTPVLNRVEEKNALMRALDNNGLRNRVYFRSPCVCTDSAYLRSAYSEIIEKTFNGCNVVQIDAGALFPFDFDATENNVFVRSCREGKNNVYIIRLNGKLDDRIVSAVRAFASSGGRKSFPITRLGIGIDLSAVLSILICDVRNAKLLDGVVSAVNIADISDSETEFVLKDVLRRKRVDFEMKKLTIDSAAKGILLGIPIDKIGDLLDVAILSTRSENGCCDLSAEKLRQCMSDLSAFRTYGFGGNFHNAKK